MTGAVLVRLGSSDDAGEGDEAYGADSSDENVEDEHVMLTVGPMGASKEGVRVPQYEPLGFLQQ